MNKPNSKNAALTSTSNIVKTRSKPKKANVAAIKAAKSPVKVNTKPVNAIYWGVSIILVGGVSVLNTLYAEEYNAITRLLIVVVSIVLALGSFILTNQGRNFIKFCLESLIELKKIYWPTRKEALITALIVTAISVLVSFMFFIFDAVINQLINIITKISF